VASHKVLRPVFKSHERGIMVLLSRIVCGWRDAVLLVKPEAILRWHRDGFRLFWKWKPRKRKPAKAKVSAEQIALTRKMASATSTRQGRIKGSANALLFGRRPGRAPMVPPSSPLQFSVASTITTKWPHDAPDGGSSQHNR
jgi:hypothetical protein